MTGVKPAYVVVLAALLVALLVAAVSAVNTVSSDGTAARNDDVMSPSSGEPAGAPEGAGTGVAWDPRGEFDSGGILQLDLGGSPR